MEEKKKTQVVTKKQLKERLQEISKAVSIILRGTEDPELKAILEEIDREYSQIRESMEAGYDNKKREAIDFEKGASSDYKKQWRRGGEEVLADNTGSEASVQGNPAQKSKLNYVLKLSDDNRGKYDALKEKYQKIQAIQDQDDIDYEEKRARIREIIDSEGWDIFGTAQDLEFEEQLEDIKRYLSEDAKREQEDNASEGVSIENETIENAITIRSGIVVVRSLTGKFTTNAALKGASILSKYYALRGEEEKQKELLKKARKFAQRRVSNLRKANMSTIQMVRNAQKIYDKTDNYDERVQTEQQLKDRKKAYEDVTIIQATGEDDESYKKRVQRHGKNIAKAGKKINPAMKNAADVNEVFHNSAMVATALGMHRVADVFADMSINASKAILDYARNRNEQLFRAEFGFTDKRIQNAQEVLGFFDQMLNTLKSKTPAAISRIFKPGVSLRNKQQLQELGHSENGNHKSDSQLNLEDEGRTIE